MMGVPRVSIVLPTYNGSRYLEQSIRSCLDQTFRDLELIIVDDCSTDETPQIISRFVAADARVRTVRNERNCRLPGSLNSGFAVSRGRYLTWTSDDNLYRPDAISQMVGALDEDPQAGLVYAPMTYIDATGKPQGPGYSGGPPDTLAYRNPVGACFLYRREVYETIGDYVDGLFLVEDWDYWLRVAERFRLRTIPNDLYLYRLHEGSLTRQRQGDIQRAFRQLLEYHLPRMHWVSRGSRARGHFAAARLAWAFGDRRGALRHLGRAFHYSPTFTLFRLAGEPLYRLRNKMRAQARLEEMRADCP